MKKNLLSVLILALMLVNIVMTAIMMISVMSTNQKTGDLVASVAAAINLEVYDPGGNAVGSVPLSQTETYSLSDRLTIELHPSVNEEGKSNASLILFYMSLSMNKEHEDYKNLGSTVTGGNFDIQIKDAVSSVISNYTEQECRDNFDLIRDEMLTAVQNLFQSSFIYRISLSDVVYQ